MAWTDRRASLIGFVAGVRAPAGSLTCFLPLLLVPVVGVADYLTGTHVSFAMLYLVPVLLGAVCRRSAGVVLAIACAASWLTAEALSVTQAIPAWALAWNAFSRLLIFLLVALGVSFLRSANVRLEEAVEMRTRDLEQEVERRRIAEISANEHAERLGGLHAIDRAISASLDIAVTMDVFMDKVHTLLGADAASVLLIDPATRTLKPICSRGFTVAQSDCLSEVRIDSHVRQLMHAKEPQSIDDLSGHAQANERLQRCHLAGFRSYVAAPIAVKGEFKGIVEVFGTAPRRFDDARKGFLGALAGQAAIAIEEAHMFEELRESREALRVA